MKKAEVLFAMGTKVTRMRKSLGRRSALYPVRIDGYGYRENRYSGKFAQDPASRGVLVTILDMRTGEPKISAVDNTERQAVVPLTDLDPRPYDVIIAAQRAAEDVAAVAYRKHREELEDKEERVTAVRDALGFGYVDSRAALVLDADDAGKLMGLLHNRFADEDTKLTEAYHTIFDIKDAAKDAGQIDGIFSKCYAAVSALSDLMEALGYTVPTRFDGDGR